MAQENVLLEGYERKGLTVAEFVGDSYYTTKIGGSSALYDRPEDAFFCSWSTEHKAENYTFVQVVFRLDVNTMGIGELLWLSEIRLQNRQNKTLRSFDYRNSSFNTYD